MYAVFAVGHQISGPIGFRINNDVLDSGTDMLSLCELHSDGSFILLDSREIDNEIPGFLAIVGEMEYLGKLVEDLCELGTLYHHCVAVGPPKL